MQARFVHWCEHVLDLDKSMEFYEKALGMHETRRVGPADGSWCNVYMANDAADVEIELTWNDGRTEPYANGGMDVHIAFCVDDFDAYHELHASMGCIQKENLAMGLYFITSPDGDRIEILPEH